MQQYNTKTDMSVQWSSCQGCVFIIVDAGINLRDIVNTQFNLIYPDIFNKWS